MLFVQKNMNATELPIKSEMDKYMGYYSEFTSYTYRL